MGHTAQCTVSSSVTLYILSTIARKIYFKLKTNTQWKFQGVSSCSTNSQLAKFHVQIQVPVHMAYPVIALILQSTKKTNIILSAPGKMYNDPLITVNGQILIY